MPDINQPQPNLPDSSAIKNSKLNNFLSSLFGWQRSPSFNKSNSHKVDFVKVDVESEQKIGQSLANSTVTKNGLSEKLDKLFNSWLTDNTDKTLELQNRKNRVDQLEYAVLNEPVLNRTVAMYADEACQLDEQDTILNIETPDPRMTRDMYKLLAQWGVTQTRIRAAIEQIATYGDAFWANKVTDKGVERIIPLKQLNVTDRLEFNPVDALEKMKRKEGSFNSFAANNYIIDKMLDSMEDTSNFADIFDTKLFGFTIEDDLVVPPWAITHFRVNADNSEFFPFGTSPIIGTLAPFKQVQSTIALQSLARVMSFPIQIYKVKTSESMDEGRQFGVVNRVRETYDNIGVSPAVGSSEVYTVNTKVWIPEGLLNVETVDPKVETGDVEDLKLYQDRLSIAAGIPSTFFSEGFYEGVSNSGRALTQQYKPFARKVYSIQTAFLESLADLFRIHFAVTGQYDFRIPFTISMKYPAIEESSDVTSAKKDSIDLATTVVDLVKASIGAEEDESLPPDIVRDIISKYTFIDPADIMKWTRDAKYDMLLNGDNNAAQMPSGGGSPEGGDSTDLGSMEDMEGMENTEDESADINLGGPEEETKGPELSDEGGITLESKKIYKKKLREASLREKTLKENYNNKKEDIYFKVLNENAIEDFNRDDHHIHFCKYTEGSLDLMLTTLAKESTGKKSKKKLKESFNC